jgi:hypothetical protein
MRISLNLDRPIFVIIVDVRDFDPSQYRDVLDTILCEHICQLLMVVL